MTISWNQIVPIYIQDAFNFGKYDTIGVTDSVMKMCAQSYTPIIQLEYGMASVP
jgi:hypothetical protein